MKPNIQLLIWGFIVCALVTRYCNPFRCPYLCDDTKMSSVSWPRICSAGRLSLCGLIPQRSRCLLLSLSLSLSQDKKSSDNEEDLTAVRRLLFYHLSVWLFWSHFFSPPPPPLLLNILNSMQMFLRGVRLFVDLLDVASVSQGLMLSGYLRLEYLVVNVNSWCESTVLEC